MEFRLIVALAGSRGGCGRPIQGRERVVEPTGLGAGFRRETKPLGIEHAGAGPVPVRQTGLKLRDPLRPPAEADQSKAAAYVRERKPLRQAMLARALSQLTES